MTLTVCLATAAAGPPPLLRSHDDVLVGLTSNVSPTAVAATPVLSVRLGGELDLRGLPLLHAALAGLREHVEVTSLSLDLRHLTFIDLQGLRGLLSACAQQRDLGAHVCVTGAAGQVLRLLRMAVSQGWLVDLPTSSLIDRRCPDHAGSLVGRASA